MRSMGASRGKLFFTTVMEGTSLTLVGSVIGLAIGHGVLFTFVTLVEDGQKAGISALVFYPEEAIVFAGSFILGIICSLIPAFQAYRTDIHKVLAGN
jgi:putative ABC transport system permease protein